MALDLQVHQVVFHLLDPLIELFKLLPVLRFRLRGRKVARLDLVEDDVEPVAGQVEIPARRKSWNSSMFRAWSSRRASGVWGGGVVRIA